MFTQDRLRGLVMFLLACFTSPCCTPLVVPIILALLAGTPVAVWMSQHLGWVYGVLTLISLISFVLALRWMGKRKASQPTRMFSSTLPTISPLAGDKAHAEKEFEVMYTPAARPVEE